MDFRAVFRKAYDMIGESTPLSFDCGTLCSKACCRGDEETGMYLYPKEDGLLTQACCLIEIKQSNLILGGTPVKLAVCGGNCDRNLRPLACRLFPLVPYIHKHRRKLKIIVDPRALAICPAVRHADYKSLDRSFVRNVRRVCKMLARIPEIYEFIKTQSRVIDDYLQIQADWIKF